MNWSLSELGWGVGAIAFFWGILSAVSLPLGAGAGVRFRPGKLTTSVLMAFGAGALLFALTIELFGHALHRSHEYGHGLVYATIVGALIGGLLFDVLNQLLNNRGAFLRNISNSKNYLERRKLLTARHMINQLSKNRLLRTLPPTEIALMVGHVKSEKLPNNTVIFRQGEPADSLYFIAKGAVELRRKEFETEPETSLGEHDDMSLLHNTLLRHPERYGSYHDVQELLKLIRRQQEELWMQAQTLGKIIFLEKPQHVDDRLKHYCEKARREDELKKISSVDKLEAPQNNEFESDDLTAANRLSVNHI